MVVVVYHVVVACSLHVKRIASLWVVRDGGLVVTVYTFYLLQRLEFESR